MFSYLVKQRHKTGNGCPFQFIVAHSALEIVLLVKNGFIYKAVSILKTVTVKNLITRRAWSTHRPIRSVSAVGEARGRHVRAFRPLDLAGLTLRESVAEHEGLLLLVTDLN